MLTIYISGYKGNTPNVDRSEIAIISHNFP